ncbi:efflux RND transporter periplasmic adaptor subunit [Agromyces sp. NPDC056965]|uniref:efflux RND transporter periplasmic adaptor subunit n=1 Tax=Agromyces sp. NPDC056965 TaxID=3345983 RepID=UPI00363CED9F
MNRRKWWVVGTAVGLTVATAATIAVVSLTPAAAPNPSSEATAVVERSSVVSTVSGKGALAAVSTANASFASAGTVTGIAVTLGQTVTAGQDLATIDPAAADRDLEKARGAHAAAGQAVETARANAARARGALDAARTALQVAAQAPVAAPVEGVPSEDRPAKIAAAQQAVREAETAAATSETEIGGAVRTRDDAARDVAAAESARTQTTLKAPIGGVVTAINGTIGSAAAGGGNSQAGAGQAQAAASNSPGFIQISDTSSWMITVAVSELDVTKVAVGQAAKISLPGAGNEMITGEVTIVSPTPASATDGVVSYPVSVKLNEVPKNPRLGLTAFVEIVVAEAKDVPTLPSEAITETEPGSGGVRMRTAKGAVTFVEVKTGVTGDGKTEIKSGVKPGDTVIIDIPTGQPTQTGDDADTGLELGAAQ